MRQISQFSDSKLDAQELHLILVVAGTLAYACLAALNSLSPADEMAFLWGGPLESLPPLLIVLTGEVAAAAFICVVSEIKFLSPLQENLAGFAEFIILHLLVAWQTRLSYPAIDLQFAVKMMIVRIFSHLDFSSHLTICWTPGVSPRIDYA